MTSRYETKKLKQGFTHIIGCDEVGRGCLAGPVVSAAVILPLTAENDKSPTKSDPPLAEKVKSYPSFAKASADMKVIKSCGIRDSKLLLPGKRKKLSKIIKENCLGWGIGVVDEKIIDEINIHNASLLAMRRAVENLLCVIPSASEESLIRGTTIKGSLRSSDALVGRDDTTNFYLFLDGKFIIPRFGMKQEAVVDGDNKILSVAAASIVAKVYRDELMRKLHKQYPIYNFARHKGYATLQHRRMILRHGLSQIHRQSFCGHLA